MNWSCEQASDIDSNKTRCPGYETNINYAVIWLETWVIDILSRTSSQPLQNIQTALSGSDDKLIATSNAAQLGSQN